MSPRRSRVTTALLFLVACAAGAAATAPLAEAAAKGPPTLSFTESYRGALTRSFGYLGTAETERCAITATLPYSGSPDDVLQAFTPVHVGVGRLSFDGTLGDDPKYVPGLSTSARLVVSSERICDDLGENCRTRVYATATIRWIAGRGGRPGKVLIRVSGVRGRYAEISGEPGTDFSILAASIGANEMIAFDGGGSASPSAIGGTFAGDSVVRFGDTTATFETSYSGTSRPGVRRQRVFVEFDEDGLPIIDVFSVYLVNVSLRGAGELK
jgi:hypothetical protein